MIIQSVRLKHVKSYGEGPGGNGVSLAFEPGVNRIAGANGHGKTTIVEAVGYALFFADPVFEERLRVETYLLSHGAKAGEIDVTFAVDGATYRLERGIGVQSRRRAKVVDAADDSVCAEGDREVAAFLCDLFHLPSQRRLQRLFSDLIGVKQGRLTRPFDSSAGEAKRHFDSLLEVEVFRDCYDRLKPVVDRFDEERRDRELRQAVLDEQIRERADAVEALRLAQEEVAAQRRRLEDGETALRAAAAEKKAQEALERAAAEAERACAESRLERRNIAQRREEAGSRVEQAEAARKQVEESAAGYLAYQEADAQLKALDERRRQRDVLSKDRETAEGRRLELSGKLETALGQRAVMLEQRRARSTQRDRLAEDLARTSEALESGRAEFEREQAAARDAAEDGAAVAAWANALPSGADRARSLASAIAATRVEVQAWDAAAVERAREGQRACAKALSDTRGAVASLEERIGTLAEQLEQIAGGICPFLKDSCPRFDPSRVEDDLSALRAELATRRDAADGAESAHREAEILLGRLLAEESQLTVKRDRLEKDAVAYAGTLAEVRPGVILAALERLAAMHPDISWSSLSSPSLLPHGHVSVEGIAGAQEQVERFTDGVASHWPDARQRLAQRLEQAAAARTTRARSEAEAQNLARQVAALGVEIAQLDDDAAEKESAAGQLEASLAGQREVIQRLDERLEPMKRLDADIDVQRAAREANHAGYEAYLLAKPHADDLENRRARLDALTRDENDIVASLARREEQLAAAKQAFDPEHLAAARQRHDQQVAAVAEAKAHLAHARSAEEKQEGRVAEWRRASAEQATVVGEVSRLTAAIALTELARKTLRNAAPEVAQHLCTRIAGRAQAVYNQISSDPVELGWDAEHYSLRITPGDRRFAMLSGGEQTKLALAMTLAMVEEFSGLRFCIFDEPTYGVDAESRGRLADAILQVQDAAALDQVWLVSHDDAFEGRIEHTVVLRKSAAGGTYAEG